MLQRALAGLRPGPDTPEALPSTEQDAISRVLATHQRRTLHLQAALRVGLVCAAAVEFLLYPPRLNAGATEVLMVLYALYAIVMLILAWSELPVRHVAWAVLLVDLPAVALLLCVSGAYSDPAWSSPFTFDWVLMIVLMSAFQLRPVVTAVTGTVATVFYFTASTVGHAHANPDAHFTIGRTLSIAIISLVSVLISRVQQSRVRQIAELAHRRAAMLTTTLSIADRDRRDLAESLHDGPLQSVLAARLDVDEAVENGPNEALERADEALRDAARQLRSSVTELHPSVLERAGLHQALDGLAQRAAARGKFTAEVRCTAESAGHDADRLLYNCVRELLANVVKHARADRVEVFFGVEGDQVRLSVADDGVGVSPELLRARAAEGHIGLASQRLRFQEIGGSFTVRPNEPAGTVVEVRFPLRPEPLPADP
ncbi:sensor histidine kinase [Streptomyces sp. NPDC059918]|uniref:sensor histidine kinase n=1 Tax=unclassified Streptomyces TaxID=2593676 RepID=UPI00364EBAE7